MSYVELKESPGSSPGGNTQSGLPNYPLAPNYSGQGTGPTGGYQYSYPVLNGDDRGATQTPATRDSIVKLEDDKDCDDNNDDKLADDAPVFQDRYEDLDFESCFYEHKSTHTIPIVYKINGYVFKYTKLFVYNAFVIVFGFLMSLLWAITLGILSFVLVWIWTPTFRALMFTSGRLLPAATEPLKALLIPIVDVHARLFRQIRVKSWLNGSLMAPLLGRSAVKTDTSKTV